MVLIHLLDNFTGQTVQVGLNVTDKLITSPREGLTDGGAIWVRDEG